MILFIFLLLIFSHISSAMEQENHLIKKKKQLVTIFDVHGKFFQKDIEDVKAVLPTPFKFALRAKNSEGALNCISLKESELNTEEPLLTKPTLKSLFSLYNILKTKPKRLNHEQRKILDAANAFFILGEYFGIDTSHIDHLKFLITRYCKPEELDPELNQNEYRYSAIELFQKGLITKDDVLTPFDELDNNLGIDFTQLGITFSEFLHLFPLLKKIETNNGPLTDDNGFIISYDDMRKYLHYDGGLIYKIFYNENIFTQSYPYQLKLGAFGINSLEDISRLTNTLKNHPSTCLNLSNLHINSWEEILEHLSLTPEEKFRILTIKLNHNRIQKLSCLSLWARFWNLRYIQAKDNNITSLDEKSTEWYDWDSHAILKKVHVNVAHNNIQCLPRVLRYSRSKCGPCNWRKDKEKIKFASLNLTDNPLSAKTHLIIRNANEQSIVFPILKKTALYGAAYSFFTVYGCGILHISTFLQFLKTECIKHKDESLFQKIDRLIMPLSIPAMITAIPLGGLLVYFNNPTADNNRLYYLPMIIGLFGKKYRTNFFKTPSLPHTFPIKISHNNSIKHRFQEYLAEIYDVFFRIYRVEGTVCRINTLWKKINKLGRLT